MFIDAGSYLIVATEGQQRPSPGILARDLWLWSDYMRRPDFKGVLLAGAGGNCELVLPKELNEVGRLSAL